MKICRVNENSLIIYFADTVSEETADRIRRLLPLIKHKLGQYLIDVIPSYTSLFISFDLLAMEFSLFEQELWALLENIKEIQTDQTEAPLIELAVYYGPEVALDAGEISDHTGLSFEEVVSIHASTLYRVYAIGFAPGFAYLGNTDQRIAIPRKQTPRLKIPACSVAVAEQQTAIYPNESPGGWQIIGRAPVNPIDYQRENLTLFEVGAKVKFNRISKATFLDMGGVISPEEERLFLLEAE
ncbi:5-oxoprolinase subunit PxpB [Endozoicomonas sp. Mp262]|uniref:5-oxoprolinase subunit PxpB n=1 Tax=Endozoicomonas sp. Mp262 TaxID=2919499 RepID=UPI0021D9F063